MELSGNPEEKTVRSERIYEGTVVSLRKDSLILPSGMKVQREIIEHRGCAAAVPFVDEDTIVLVRQYRHPAGKVLLEIPAGTLQPGEHPEDCVCRELIEETGYRPGRLEHLVTMYLAPGYSSEIAHIYAAYDLVEEGMKPEEDELIEVTKLPLSQTLRMILESEIADSKTICGILVYLLRKRREEL